MAMDRTSIFVDLCNSLTQGNEFRALRVVEKVSLGNDRIWNMNSKKNKASSFPFFDHQPYWQRHHLYLQRKNARVTLVPTPLSSLKAERSVDQTDLSMDVINA
jgi:hypothetical protein